MRKRETKSPLPLRSYVPFTTPPKFRGRLGKFKEKKIDK
jgi:hypothetical protein